MNNQEICRRETRPSQVRIYFIQTLAHHSVLHNTGLSNSKLHTWHMSTETRIVLILTWPNPDQVGTQVSRSFSLTASQQLSMVGSTMGIYIYGSTHLRQLAHSVCHCMLVCLTMFSFLEYIKFIPTLKPWYHSSLCLERSSLISFHSWLFIFILVSAPMSPSWQSLPPCHVSLFQGVANNMPGARSGQ